jgi:predicted acetyltransferase
VLKGIIKMKITTYRELQSKEELLPLFQHAFWWPFNPIAFDKTIRADPRLRNSPVGYVAIIGNQVAGFVGVMDIQTRTLQESEEIVGGIWGVVTHPVHARQGIFKALMQRGHDYFREQGYKFSFLYTSKILIAYAFYRKLGYKDAIVYSSAYKVIKDPRKTAKEIRKKGKVDWDRLLELYNRVTRNYTGFVIRDKQYGKMLAARKKIQPAKSIESDKGYALLRESEGNMYVRELVALTREEVDKLIAQIEEKTAKTVVDEKVLGKNTLNTYQSRGYMIITEGYDLLMSKQLTDATLEETYGEEFYATSADSF